MLTPPHQYAMFTYFPMLGLMKYKNPAFQNKWYWHIFQCWLWIENMWNINYWKKIPSLKILISLCSFIFDLMNSLVYDISYFKNIWRIILLVLMRRGQHWKIPCFFYSTDQYKGVMNEWSYQNKCIANEAKSNEYRRNCNKYTINLETWWKGHIDLPPEFDVNPLPTLGPKVPLDLNFLV